MDEHVRATVTRGDHAGLSICCIPVGIVRERDASDLEAVLPCDENGHAKSSLSGNTAEVLADLVHIGL